MSITTSNNQSPASHVIFVILVNYIYIKRFTEVLCWFNYLKSAMCVYCTSVRKDTRFFINLIWGVEVESDFSPSFACSYKKGLKGDVRASSCLSLIYSLSQLSGLSSGQSPEIPEFQIQFNIQYEVCCVSRFCHCCLHCCRPKWRK